MADRRTGTVQETSGSYGIKMPYTYNKIRVTTMSDPINRNVIVEEAIDQVAASAVYGGTYKTGGSFEGMFRPHQMADVLASAFGKVKTSESANDVYRFNQTADVSLNLYIEDEQATPTTTTFSAGKGIGILYTGVGIMAMDITASVKEMVKAKFTWIGQRAFIVNPASITAVNFLDVDEEPSVFYNTVLTFADKPFRAKSFTLNSTRKFDEDYYFIGSEFLQGLFINGLNELGGSMTFGAGEWDQLQLAITGSITAGMLDDKIASSANDFLGANANTLGRGKINIKLYNPSGSASVAEFVIDEAVITEMNHSVTGRNQWEKTANWRAILNPENGKNFALGISKNT